MVSFATEDNSIMTTVFAEMKRDIRQSVKEELLRSGQFTESLANAENRWNNVLEGMLPGTSLEQARKTLQLREEFQRNLVQSQYAKLAKDRLEEAMMKEKITEEVSGSKEKWKKQVRRRVHAKFGLPPDGSETTEDMKVAKREPKEEPLDEIPNESSDMEISDD